MHWKGNVGQVFNKTLKLDEKRVQFFSVEVIAQFVFPIIIK